MTQGTLSLVSDTCPSSTTDVSISSTSLDFGLETGLESHVDAVNYEDIEHESFARAQRLTAHRIKALRFLYPLDAVLRWFMHLPQGYQQQFSSWISESTIFHQVTPLACAMEPTNGQKVYTVKIYSANHGPTFTSGLYFSQTQVDNIRAECMKKWPDFPLPYLQGQPYSEFVDIHCGNIDSAASLALLKQRVLHDTVENLAVGRARQRRALQVISHTRGLIKNPSNRFLTLSVQWAQNRAINQQTGKKNRTAIGIGYCLWDPHSLTADFCNVTLKSAFGAINDLEEPFKSWATKHLKRDFIFGEVESGSLLEVLTDITLLLADLSRNTILVGHNIRDVVCDLQIPLRFPENTLVDLGDVVTARRNGMPSQQQTISGELDWLGIGHDMETLSQAGNAAHYSMKILMAVGCGGSVHDELRTDQRHARQVSKAVWLLTKSAERIIDYDMTLRDPSLFHRWH